MTLFPKTRSGKVLRRSIQAIAEGRDPGDLTTIPCFKPAQGNADPAANPDSVSLVVGAQR